MVYPIRISCVVIILANCLTNGYSLSIDSLFITDITKNSLNTKHVVIFGCNRRNFLETFRLMSSNNMFTQSVHLNINYTIRDILTRRCHASTSVLVDCHCPGSRPLLKLASDLRYFNKTYQWLLWGQADEIAENIFTLDLDYVGPNAQLTYINESRELVRNVWDIHSKGRHLRSPLEVTLVATGKRTSAGHLRYDEMKEFLDFKTVQGMAYRSQYNGVKLRGAVVIDLDNITTNERIETLLSQSSKHAGISAFTKYHYEILKFVREKFNFTVNFRNARGWASYLGNTSYRVGYIGIMSRNEADIGASAAFSRLNRFAEFDGFHQSWKLETAFLYRFTPDLDGHSKGGNFLAPFSGQVWIYAIGTVLIVNTVWRLVEWLLAKVHLQVMAEVENCKRKGYAMGELTLQICAAICQQGMDPIPKSLPSRAIVLTTFVFSLVMYNYYTSSVVGGLLASFSAGPATVEEIVDSRLKLSFEDIGYYKVLFREKRSPTTRRLIDRKLLTPRGEGELPIYTNLGDAIPYLKRGDYAFHCEVVDAYPEIAKYFNVNEICELRVVAGLMETELINWIFPKNSQYTEHFRIIMCWAREIGFIQRLLRERQPRKPTCQALYTVYPVNFFGVSSAFYFLAGGAVMSVMALLIEVYISKYLS